MRLFFAVTIPEAALYSLTTTQQAFAAVPHTRAVPEKNLHITLRFLGYIPEADLPTLISRAESVQAKCGSVCVGGPVRGFPADKRWKAAVVGVEDKGQVLSQLHEQLPASPNDRRRFEPHITIARSNVEQSRLPMSCVNTQCFDVREFCLMESTLLPQGALYKVIRRFPLK